MPAVQAADKGLGWRLNLPEMPLPLRVDALRLRQVVINLLSNAPNSRPRVKFSLSMATAAPEIEGAAGGDDQRPRYRHRDRRNCMKKYSSSFQADGSTARKYGGTGLGLAISAGWVELMGGA